MVEAISQLNYLPHSTNEGLNKLINYNLSVCRWISSLIRLPISILNNGRKKFCVDGYNAKRKTFFFDESNTWGGWAFYKIVYKILL